MKLTPEEFEQICSKYKGKERDELLKYFEGKMTKEEEKQLAKRIMIKKFIETKISIRKTILEMEKWQEVKRVYRRRLSNIDYELEIVDINKVLENDREILAINGEITIGLLPALQNYLTIQEFAQLLNANPIKIKRTIEDNKKLQGKEPSFKDLIFVYHCEDHYSGSFIEDSVDNPYFVSLEYLMADKLKNDSMFKKKMDKTLDEIDPDLKKNSFTVQEDCEGRIINIKPYENGGIA